MNWDLELFDIQPATVGGLSKEFIFGGRIDDKLCSYSAIQALIRSATPAHLGSSSHIQLVGLFDSEEIGSLLRQGARGNFLPTVLDRVVNALAADPRALSLPPFRNLTKSVQGGPTCWAQPSYGLHASSKDKVLAITLARSFLVSSDVTHAVNPNFLDAYLENHSPRLNTGLALTVDASGHMTTNALGATLFARCLDHAGLNAKDSPHRLQVFHTRNDTRGGGTVGPMLSAALGVRAIDAGLPQLSMHSIRATTGSLDPGLGVAAFEAFLRYFERVDAEFAPSGED